MAQITLPANNHTVRAARGSMLGLAMISLGIIVLIFVVGLSAYVFWSREKKGEQGAEFEALTIAKALNQNDRVGQMNYVVARSRELVYLSRVTDTRLQNDPCRSWSALSRYLCDEARSGAKLVEEERQHQVTLSKNEIDTLAYRYNSENTKQPPIFAAFWKSDRPLLDDVSLGWVKNTESNVLHSDTYPELRIYDEGNGYFQKGSNLYRGNINAKLPSPDDDLDFKLCPLAAPVEGSVAPSRLIKPKAFVPQLTVYKDQKFVNGKLDQIPSALYIKQHMTVTVTHDAPHDVALQGYAAAQGAEPPPQ